MPGQGFRMTSSPTAPRTDAPFSSTTSAAIPGQGPMNELGWIGVHVVHPTMPPETSAPPEELMIGQRDSPTFRKYHHHGSGFQGSPVDPRTKSDQRSFVRTGSSPDRMSPRIAVGEMPRCVTR